MQIYSVSSECEAAMHRAVNLEHHTQILCSRTICNTVRRSTWAHAVTGRRCKERRKNLEPENRLPVVMETNQPDFTGNQHAGSRGKQNVLPLYRAAARTEYRTDGITILRGLIPPTLLADLRRETERAREIARLKHGRQAQRLQPVWNYDELNLQLFRDFLFSACRECARPSRAFLATDTSHRNAWRSFWSRSGMPGVGPGIAIGAMFRVSIWKPFERQQICACTIS